MAELGCRFKRQGKAREGIPDVFISPTLSTMFGRRRAAEQPPTVIPTLPADCLIFAQRIDRQADASLAEGRFVQAERLAHLALEARCRAEGRRA